MDKRQLDPSLQNYADQIIDKVNTHTTQIVKSHVNRAIEELACMTQREFSRLENKMDKHFNHLETRVDRIEKHLSLPKFEFSEA